MAEPQDDPQEEVKDSPQEASQTDASASDIPLASRPRNLSETERVVAREKRRDLRQAVHHAAPDHDGATSEPLNAFVSAEKTRDPVRILEDREMVKWAAWGALLVSLVTSFLLGLYSSREFEPMFEYYDLELTQKQIINDVEGLKFSNRLEKVQNAITQAQVQLLVRKDYDAAEAILERAKGDLKLLIATLPIEKSLEPKQALASVERVLAEVRRGPTLLDQQLNEISKNLSKLKN